MPVARIAIITSCTAGSIRISLQSDAVGAGGLRGLSPHDVASGQPDG
jgi:hypothetical protein